MRQDANKIEILNKARETLFKLPCPSQQIRLQYYDFGDNHAYYVLIDLDNKLTFIYGHTGQLLHDSPWENDNEVGLLLLKKEKQLRVYTSFEKSLTKYVLQLPST